MTIGLRWLLLAGAAMVLTLVVVAVWLGPGVLALLWHGDRDSAPVVMVRWADAVVPAGGISGKPVPEQPALASLLVDAGARVEWQASVARVLSGRPADLLPELQAVRWPSRTAYVDLITSSAWRAADAARSAHGQRSAVLVADVDGLPLPETGELVLSLYRFRDAAAAASWHAQHQNALEQAAQRHGGRWQWQVQLAPVRAAGAPESSWDLMVLEVFPDPTAQADWTADRRRQTDLALAQHLLARQASVRLTTNPVATGRGRS